jgi:aryl-alcohol dehydrogenase-like predicted oxidoreductase
MQTKTLGKNGPSVTALGIGTWAWGDKLFWNYGQNFGPAEVEGAFQAAIAAGITFFDTAEIYGLGESERLLGRFMKARDLPRIAIATKYGPAPWRLTKETVYAAVSQSLERLQIPQITLYQVHWPFTFLMSQATLLHAIADEVEKGHIQAVGVSNYSAEQQSQAHALLGQRGIPLAVNQVQYSLLYRTIEKQGILQGAQELGVTILAYSPLAKGLLTGKYNATNRPDGARRLDSRFQPQGLAKIAPILNRLQELATKYQKTPTQVALNWLVTQDNVIPIPGAKTAAQAQMNAGALGWQLSDADWQDLEEISRP